MMPALSLRHEGRVKGFGDALPAGDPR